MASTDGWVGRGQVGCLRRNALLLYDNDTPERQTAAAFLSSRVEKGHRVRFTYTTKTPKVTADSEASYLFSAHAVSLDSANDDVSLAQADQPSGFTFVDPSGEGTVVDGGVTFVVVQGQGGGEL